ncbi:hypothetical protein TFLX_04137 [Thermoflexales bacterium]|nr:hypothetical protein TFLX_04137 [Thermoflexales bacterium]
MSKRKLLVVVQLLFCSAWLAVALSAPPAASLTPTATVRYVKPSATGTGNCLSWANACTLPTALTNAVSGDELWVKAGTYKPGTSGNTAATFQLKSGVAIYGGFIGTETNRDDRDFVNNVTSLSGDLDSSGGHTGADAFHVVTASGVDTTAILDGFTITSGNANYGCMPNDGGGGLHSVNGSPTLSNLIFTHNYAHQQGGGAYFESGAPVLTNIMFISNTALYGGGAALVGGAATLTQITFTENAVPDGAGGGLYLQQGDQIKLKDMTFNNNWAVDGGGMAIQFYANPTLENVTFNNNYADWKGGGVYVYYYSQPILKNVTFRQNYAVESGGGIMTNNHSAVTLVNGVFSGNTAGYAGGGIYENHGSYSSFVNALFTGNHSQGNSGGGAEIAHGNLASHTTFINTTFTGNTAGVNGGGGIYIAYGSQITLTNSILWGNTTTTSIFRAHQIGYFEDPWNSGQVIVNNDIQDDFWGTDIISSDPLFVDADGADNVYGTADDNAHLQSGSPVISLGNLAWLPADQADLDGDGNITEKTPYALDGHPRLIHGLDLGAYEAGAVWYVDDNGAALNGCTAWADACPSLQTALGKATSGDEIWVAAGTYKPGASGVLTATFQLKSGVAVYGGFNGSGTSRADRNWLTQPTILSGDLDASGSLTANDAYHVVTGANNARLDGFIISGGRAMGSAPHNRGGGLYNAGSSPTLTHLAFMGNTASASGGGVYNMGSSPLLANVLFSGNAAGTGGGLANASGSNPSLYNLTFSGNSATVSGGGMYNVSSTFTLRNSLLWGNTAPTQTQMANLTSTVNILYSDIQGAFAGGFWNVALGTNGGGNLDANPLFTDANGTDNVYGTLDDNARQQPGSPVINAGSNEQLPADAGDLDGNGNTSETLPYDLDSRPRIEGRVVDLGAYETGDAAPIIPSIATQTTAEDTPTSAIIFTVGDSDTPATLLTVSAQSSNPALVPLANIALAGTGITRTITLTPMLNQFGQTVITLSVSDGSLMASAGFTLTVTPVNDAPTISNILDHLAALNAPTHLDFTVGDVDTPLAALTFSFASSNLLVAPVENFAISGTGVTRTLTFTGTNTQGTSAITVTVSDGALTAADSFGMYVFPTAGTRYAITNGLTSGLCNTWATACTLSQAISVSVSGDEVWVAAGIYKPGSSGVRASTFQLKNGVAVYGGFNGTETDRAARNWTSNVTILSGDLDGSGSRNSNDAYHVIRNSGVDSTAILDGFTITGGNVTHSDPAPTGGGGMVNENSSPTLANLIFSGNGAYNGGGMYNSGSSPSLTNITFSGNAAELGGSGGGLYNRSNSNATLTNVIFKHNTSSFIAGGMYNSQSNASLSNVLFIGNRADSRGGAMLIELGGSTLKNVSFIGNSAAYDGGALHTWGGSATPSLTNCIFWGNTTDSGSNPQIYNEYGGNPSLTYSDIQGGYAGTGNVDIDPLFVDADGADNIYGTADDDPRLAANSPLIDLGHPAQCPATDIRSLTRNDLRCDMGAYETQLVDSASITRTLSGGAATYTFGPTLAKVIMSTPGTCTSLAVERIDANHPQAISSTLQTGAYWNITRSPAGCTGFSAAVRMPALNFTPSADTKLCRWNSGISQWECGLSGEHSVVIETLTSGATQPYVERQNVQAFSGWTLDATGRPTLSDLPDQSVYVGLPFSATFTVSDIDTPVNSLLLSIASSNASVAPVSSFVFGGSGITRTLTFSGSMQIGTAVITVTVSDGVLSRSDSFELTVLSTAGTKYVMPTGVSTGFCLSWATACTLSRALEVALPGDEVWVVAGTYQPGSSGVMTATFQLKTGVGIYGGFTGVEITRTARNWTANPTILSGDLDASGNLTANDAYHVVTGSGVDSSAVLDGFTITGGNARAASAPHNQGGGVYVASGNPILANLIISGNATNTSTGYGGGLYATASNVTLTHVTFTSNAAYGGGGMVIASESAVTLTHVTFANNSANGSGGGMNNTQSSATLVNVVFRGNTSSGNGGGMVNHLLNNRPCILENVIFNGNFAFNGGGLFNDNSQPQLTNVTFFSNTAATSGGGLMNTNSSLAILTNSILWQNTAPTNAQIHNEAGANSVVTYSDIQGGYTGAGNLNVDPLFEDANGADNVSGTADDNLRLVMGSPAIDAGNTLSVTTSTDLDGNPRLVGTAVDLGAYEAQLELRLIQSVMPADQAPYHGVVTYTLVLSNQRVLAESQVFLTDTLPTEVDFGQWLERPVGATVAGDVISWNGALAGSTAVTFTFTARHVGDLQEWVTNVATFSGTLETGHASATFQVNAYVITPTAGAGGHITPDTLQVVDHGENSTFTITPDPGYHILDVGVDGLSIGVVNIYTFTNVTADHTISATFGLSEYALTTGVMGQGQVTRTPDQATYLHGSVVTLTALPEAGWYFGQWLGAASGVLTQTTVFMDANKVVTATFLNTPPTYYTLTLSMSGSGFITPTVGAHSYLSGTVVPLSASPAAGWQFIGWSGDVDCADGSVTLNANKLCTATFARYRLYLPLILK